MVKKKVKKEVKKCSCFMKNNTMWQGLTILFVVLFVFSIATAGFTNFSRFTERSPTGNVVGVDLYVMSQCPYGVQAEAEFISVVEELGPIVDLNIEYIGNYEGDKFSSLHGQKEVVGNMVQLCVDEYFPDDFLDFIECQNANPKEIPGNWESCAEKLNLDYDTIAECLTGSKGSDLLKASFDKASALGIGGSPTIYINDEKYEGSRDALSLMVEICQKVSGGACSDLPECSADEHCASEGQVGVCKESKCEFFDAADVDLVVLNDVECGAACSSAQLESVMKDMFKGVNIKQVDISSAEGQKLVEDFDIVYVPAYILDKRIVNTHTWKTNVQMRGYFKVVGDSYMLNNDAVGSTHYASKELLEKHLSELGISTGDNKPQVDFFVMSYCPYGNIAEEAMYEAYSVLGDKAEFKPHYIFYPNYQGEGPDFCIDSESKYCSMHGVQEANQDIREICVLNHMGLSEWFDFVIAANAACDYKNVDSCWEGVAQGLGLDVDVIKNCESSEGLELAAKEFELASLFGAKGSPAVYVDGITFAGDRSANGYLQGICNGFDDKPSECGQVINEVNNNAPATGGCGV